MFLERIRIANFKSLKDVEITPSGLVTLVGPNGAGKTNFALAMKFLAEVYQHGLEAAIARAGGIENIALRKMRRSRSPITFDVRVAFEADELARLGLPRPITATLAAANGLVIRHAFSCKPLGASIRAEYAVQEETLQVLTRGQDPHALVYELKRDARNHVTLHKGRPFCKSPKMRSVWAELADRAGALLESRRRSPQQTVFAPCALGGPLPWALSEFLGELAVFRFSPGEAREGGTPTPNPTLGMRGSDLPALVDWLQRKRKARWQDVLEAMRDVVPALEDIVVQILPTKRLGLYFTEEGIGRPWRADEVSDGTMHALCLLVACADPRVSALVIEEPENSLHPWALEELGKRLRKLAKTKTVMVTTQSPVFIDLLYPSEVWIVSRAKGHTSIRRLTDIDAQIEEDWRDGQVGLSKFLGAGLVPCAVPGGGEP